MSIVETSVVLRALRGAWLAVLLWIRESNLARWYLRAEQAVARAFRGSRIFTVLFRRGAVLRAWEGSLACRALTAAAGLIPRGLRRLYLPLRDIWEGSAAFRIAGALGNNVGVILSWFFLLLTACPHRYWNNLYTLAAVLVCTALLFFACARTGAPRLEVGRLNPYLWAFVFMLFVGVAESSSRRVSLRYLMFFLSAILLCLLALSAADSVERLRRMAAFGCAGMIPSALYGAYQLLVLGVTNTSSTADLTLNAEMPGRVSSYFDNPNTYAQVLVMLLGVGLGLLFACRTVRGRIACLVCLGFGAAGILMTYSRASWVGLAAAIFLFVLLAKPRLLPVLILGGLALLPALPASIYNRILTIFNPSDSSTSSRFPIYEVGLRIWRTSPLVGTGLGSEISAALAHNSGWYHRLFRFPHYHNIYLQLAVETGLLGLLSYAAGFLGACKDSLRAVRAAGCPRDVRCLVIGCFSGLAGVMICGLADYFWHYPRVMAIFWLIFGMMLAGIRLAGCSRAEQAAE